MSPSAHALNIQKKGGIRITTYSVSDYGDEKNAPLDDDEEFRRSRLYHTDTDASFKSISHYNHAGHKFYRPLSNRTWVMCAFLCAVGLCIVLLELAIATHGSAHQVTSIRTRGITVEHTQWIWKRQPAAEVTTAAVLSSQGTTATQAAQTSSDTDQSVHETSGTSTGSASPTSETYSIFTPGQPGAANELTVTSDGVTSPSIIVTSSTAGGGSFVPNPNNQLTLTSTSDHGTTPSGSSSTIQVTLSSPDIGKQVTLTSQGVISSSASANQVTISSQRNSGTTAAPSSYPGGGGSTSLLAVASTQAYNPTASQAPTLTQSDGKIVTSYSQGQTTAAQAASTSAATGPSVVSGSALGSSRTTLAISSSTAPPTGTSVISGSTLGSSGNTLITSPSTQARTGGSLITATNSLVTTSAVRSTTAVVLLGADGIVTTSTLSTNAADLGGVTLSNTNSQATAIVASSVYTDEHGLPTTTIFSTQTPKSTASTSSVGSNTFGNLSSSTEAHPMTQFDYFCAIYLPTLMAIGIQSAWLIAFSSFKMMEPFFQLAQPGGAMAASSLTADYLSYGLSFSFIKAGCDGHWVMCLAGTVQLFSAIVVSLASRIFKVVPTAYCKTEVSDRQPCNPVWIVNLPAIRAAEVLLVACFSMIISLTWLNRRRISGVYSDPTRIATIADLTIHEPLIQEIRDLPPNATKQQVVIDLAESRYMLGIFDAYGKQHCGIIKLETPPQHEFTRQAPIKAAFERFGVLLEISLDNINKRLPLLPDFLSIAVTTILFFLIFAYMLIPGTDSRPFNNFMNSGHFGPGFLLNVHGILISTFVKRKERLLRLSHPYVLMSKSPSKPASHTITTGIPGTQYDSIWKSSIRGNFMLASLSLAAFFADMIIVLMPGIPWTQAQTVPMYKASTYICLALLLFLFVVQVYVMYDEWRCRDMPAYDCPETLASVLIRLCASRFVEEKNIRAGALRDRSWDEKSGGDRHRSFTDSFSEFGMEHEQKQKHRYEGLSDTRRYHVACMEGVDGVHRFMIDEDVRGRR